MKPTNIKKLQSRSRDLRVARVNSHTFRVTSISHPEHEHFVTLVPDQDGRIHSTCNCEWSRFQGIACTHVMAALDFVAKQKGRKLSFWQTQEDARRQKNRIFELTGRDETVWITSRAS